MLEAPKASRRNFLAAVAALAAAPAVPAAAQTGPTIRVLTVGQEGGALAIYAKEAGFFQRAGLNVDVQTSNSGSSILASTAGGAVEVGESNVGSVAGAVLSGLQFSIFADCSLYKSTKPTLVLCAALNSPYKVPKDLAGKKIGVGALKNLSQAAPQAWLDKNGVDSSGIGWVEMPYSAMAELLNSGKLDAAVIPEPTLTAVRSRVRIIASPYDAIGRQFSLGSYFANTDWISKNRALTEKIANVLRQTAIWANNNHQQTGQILVNVLKMTPDIVATMTRAEYSSTLELANLQPSIDVMAKYGDIQKRIDAATLVTRV